MSYYLKREGMRALTPGLHNALEEYREKAADQKEQPHPLKGVSSEDFKSAMKHLGYPKQKDIADLIGKDKSTVSKKIKDPAKFTAEEYSIISETIHLRESELIGEYLFARDGYGKGHEDIEGMKQADRELEQFHSEVIEKIGYRALRKGINEACKNELPYRLAIESITVLSKAELEYLLTTLEMMFRAKNNDRSKTLLEAIHALKKPNAFNCERALVNLIQRWSIANYKREYSLKTTLGGEEEGYLYEDVETGLLYTDNEWREAVLREYSGIDEWA